MKPGYKVVALIIVMLTWVAGCSSSNDSTISPNIIEDSISSTNKLPVFVSDNNPDKTPSTGMGIFGLFQVHIDPTSMTGELVSLRESSLTDVLEVVDITNFLQLAPCTNYVKIKSVSLDFDGNLVLSIGIKHPFPVGDPSKPITNRNRADLHVFNVEGIVISNSHGTTFSILDEKISGLDLINADGYTNYLDSSIDRFYPTEATIHPYILHFDDYSAGNFDSLNPMGFQSVTDPPPYGNLVMTMGCDYDFKDYVFNIQSEPIDFIYAIGCTYGVSASSKSRRFFPEYRIPQHNKKAASEIRVDFISNGLRGEETSSMAKIEVRVVDVNHNVPAGSRLNEMLLDSSINRIIIDIPGIINGPVVIDGRQNISGTGHSPSDPLVYQAIIFNDTRAPEGEYKGLVKILDNYAVGANESPLLFRRDGIQRVNPPESPLTGLFMLLELASYQTFEISVACGNDPPVAILLTDPSPARIHQFEKVKFDATTSYDIDSPIVLYEFDFDWNGREEDFEADESNTSGIAESYPYNTMGMYSAGLRVSDNLGLVDYDSVSIEVMEPAIIYVDNSYVGPPWRGTVNEPYNTIQDGLNAAPNDYQVWVDDSGINYEGPISLKSNVILKSVNWDGDDGSEMAVINYTGYNPVVVGSNDAAIDGFLITGGGYVSSLGRVGILISDTDTIVRNCRIQNINHAANIYGIFVENSSGSLIENCEISEINSFNSFNNVFGIFLNSSPITVRNSVIHDISVFDMSHIIGGIYASMCYPQSGQHLILKQNRIYNISSLGPMGGSYCDGFGMNINLSTAAEISNNLIYSISTGDFNNSDTSKGTCGIYIINSNNVDLANNTIYDVHKTSFYGSACGLAVINCNGFNGYNNIISNIYHNGPLQSSYGIDAPSGIRWQYCDVFNAQSGSYTGGIEVGVGCISEDPMFFAPGIDFHLNMGSPCINTGDPGILDPDFSRSDMGCYGGPGGDW